MIFSSPHVSAPAPDVPVPVLPASSASGLPYHRLAHAWPTPRRWKPLLGLVLGVVICAGAALTGLVLVLIPAVILRPDDELSGPSEVLDFYEPWDFALGFGAIALLLPAVLLGFRITGCRPLGLLSSVAGRLRWRWMLRCVLPAVVVAAVMAVLCLWTGLSEAHAVDMGLRVPAVMLLLALVLVPLQAAAEEYVFRGALMQVIGAWLKHPAWAILLPVPLFVLGHGYDLPGQTAVGVFAVAMGWVTWRTGGLEAAIVLHVVNNVVVAVLGFHGVADLNATEVAWSVAIADIVATLLYVLWVEMSRRRPARTTDGPAGQPHAGSPLTLR